VYDDKGDDDKHDNDDDKDDVDNETVIDDNCTYMKPPKDRAHRTKIIINMIMILIMRLSSMISV
jgi:hypothetical protein